MRVFILEDNDERIHYFKKKLVEHSVNVYKTASDAIDALQERVFNILFLDNDLGDCAGSGIDVADFLHRHKDNINNNAVIIVHSCNPPAATTITSLLPRAYLFPYGTPNFYNVFT